MTPQSQTMVERVARAIMEDSGGGRDRPDFNWRYYESAARAAIEAMRLPTTEMITAGLNCDAWANAEGNAVEMLAGTFSAMISAALQD